MTKLVKLSSTSFFKPPACYGRYPYFPPSVSHEDGCLLCAARGPCNRGEELVEVFSWITKAIAQECYQEGVFKLPGGKAADNYLDLWLLLTRWEFMREVAFTMQEMTRDLTYQAVGGCAMAAMPIADALMHVGDRDMHTFLVRKRAKGYGTDKIIEGRIKPGERALIVEDVASTGMSMAHTVATARGYWLDVVGAITIVDREEGAAELLEKQGITLRRLTTLSEVQEAWRQKAEQPTMTCP